MTPQFILAHDLGTTGNKATLFRRDGNMVSSAFCGYGTDYPQPNWAEQDPADWQRAIFDSSRRLLAEAGATPDEVAVVSFSGHMNGALLVDERGMPLRPAIIWADQRATAQAEFIRRRCGESETYRLTGNRVSPAYTAAKLLWIKDNQPELFGRAYKVLQAKDYAAFLLTGVMATDYSDASLTQLFDLEERRWASGMLERLQVPSRLLPAVHPAATVIGGVTKEAAAASGLQAGTPVVIGGGDGGCATVGAGAVRVGEIYTYIGSSSWVALSCAEPVLDPHERTFNIAHLVPDLNIAIGVMQAAGGAYDWFERTVRAAGQEQPQYAALDEAAAQVPAGSRGLLFLPYLLGERSPYWNPLARGAFVGLAMPHSRPEMARAVLEGVAFNLRHILDIVRGQGAAAEAALAPEGRAGVRLIGGGGKSALWRQILADVYGMPIARLQLPAQATALGAAVAGGVGVGILSGYDAVQEMTRTVAVDRPDPAVQARYAQQFELFKEAYAALEPIFTRLATLA